MDLLDILLARKMALADIGKIEGGVPIGGEEGYILAQGADGPVWIDPTTLKSDSISIVAGSLLEVFEGQEAGLYTCQIEEKVGICSIMGEQTGWCIVFDDAGECYTQFCVSGVEMGWKQLAEKEDDSDIIFNAGGASND